MAVKMNSPLFIINNFVFHYPDTKTPSVDFSKANLVIPRGKKTFFLGPSGCGKTTLLQILGLLRDATNLAPSTITMDGTQDYSKLSPNDKTAIRGKNFGFILQSFYLLPNFRVLENIAMPLILNGMHRRNACDLVREVIKDSGLCGSDENDLNQVLDHTSDKLSQGAPPNWASSISKGPEFAVSPLRRQMRVGASTRVSARPSFGLCSHG